MASSPGRRRWLSGVVALLAVACGTPVATLPPVPSRSVTAPPAVTPTPTATATTPPSDSPSPSPTTAAVRIPTRGDLIQTAGPGVAAFADGGAGRVADALGFDIAALAMASSGDDAARVTGIRFPGASAEELLASAAAFVGPDALEGGLPGEATTIAEVDVLSFEREGVAVHVTAFGDVVYVVEGTDAAEVERLISLIPEVVD